MGFFEDLANAKTREQGGGAYFFPNQTGTLLIHGLVQRSANFKTSVILVGEIVKSFARVPNAPVQPPGTVVKSIYVLSSQPWKIDQLKTDLVGIMGIPKDLGEKELAGMFGAAFNDGALKGVLCGFETWTKKREGKIDITQIKFSHLDETMGNSEKEINERAAKLPDVNAKA